MKRHFPQDHEPSQQCLPAAQLLSPPLVACPPQEERDKGEGARGRGFSACRTGLVSAPSVDGFTLIEVMVAVVILMFGLLVVGSMQISAIRGNYMSGNTSMALSLAGEKMEDLLNRRDYSNDPDLAAGNHGPESISKAAVSGAGSLYSRSWTVTNETSPDRKNVVVTVSWENNKHRLSIASIKNQVIW
jgi:prepilin-type N-terminal cleavage/methylation domain-containing protein